MDANSVSGSVDRAPGQVDLDRVRGGLDQPGPVPGLGAGQVVGKHAGIFTGTHKLTPRVAEARRKPCQDSVGSVRSAARSSWSTDPAGGHLGRAVPAAGELDGLGPQVGQHRLHRLDLDARPRTEGRQVGPGPAVVEVDVVGVPGVVEVGQHVREPQVQAGREGPVGPAGGLELGRRRSPATGRSGRRRRRRRPAGSGPGRTPGRSGARSRTGRGRRSSCRRCRAGRRAAPRSAAQLAHPGVQLAGEPGVEPERLAAAGRLVDQRQAADARPPLQGVAGDAVGVPLTEVGVGRTAGGQPGQAHGQRAAQQGAAADRPRRGNLRHGAQRRDVRQGAI